jgi:hypothetical protein
MQDTTVQTGELFSSTAVATAAVLLRQWRVLACTAWYWGEESECRKRKYKKKLGGQQAALFARRCGYNATQDSEKRRSRESAGYTSETGTTMNRSQNGSAKRLNKRITRG